MHPENGWIRIKFLVRTKEKVENGEEETLEARLEAESENRISVLIGNR